MWIQSPKAQAWIKANPTVAKWLSRIGSNETRSTYGQCLQAFCEWSGKSPRELISIREADPKNGWEILDVLQKFILEGTYQDKRRGHENRLVKVAETGRKRKESYYVAARSFFMHNRLELPRDRSFRIAENGREAGVSYMNLDQARAIIGALKDPFRTMFTAALYSGMRRGELLMLNQLWPDIRKQLKEGRDPVRIRFGSRKSNVKEYFTCVPPKVFKPFQDIEANPFQSFAKKGIPRVLRPIKDYDLQVAWRFARKRAGVDVPVTGHMFRDLFMTLGFKVGVRKETSDFMLGHVVDAYHYLQIKNEPEAVEREWQKLRVYLDSGISPETGEKILKQDGEIASLKEQVSLLQGMMYEKLKIFIPLCVKCKEQHEDDYFDPDKNEFHCAVCKGTEYHEWKIPPGALRIEPVEPSMKVKPAKAIR